MRGERCGRAHRAARLLIGCAMCLGLTAGPARADDETLCAFDGDVSADGFVTAGDALLALQIALQSIPYTHRQRCSADCNGDGVVSAGDAQRVFYTAMSLDRCVGGCGGDVYEPDDIAARAQPLPAATWQEHSLCPTGDHDWLTFDVQSAGNVALEAELVAGVAAVMLFDAEFSTLGLDVADGAAGHTGRIARHLPAGRYYTLVRGLAGQPPVLAYSLRWLRPAPEDACRDRQDNDGDTLSDCLDPDCDGQAGCQYGTEGACGDGLDNDADGAVDCLDGDCAGEAACEPIEIGCADRLDDDGDGLVDCLDGDCDGLSACEFGAETRCADAFDNDGDGSGDCADPDCAADPACLGCRVDHRGTTAYLFCPTPRAWADAQTTCRALGFTLASVADGAENAWLRDRVTAQLGVGQAWLGFTDAATEGVWAWESGQAASFTAWEPGVPDLVSGDAQDCAAFSAVSHPRWNDFPCGYLRAFVCEQSEVCGDGSDNDGDGFGDCVDPDCSAAPSCAGCVLETVGEAAYLLCETPRTWQEAQTLCRTHGLALAAIGDVAEQAALWDRVQALWGPTTAWHGLHYAGADGFVNDNGQRASAVGWPGGEPPAGGTGSDCVAFGAATGGTWVALPCAEAGAAHAAICERGEVCGNGTDDDGDGFGDCADPDCSEAPACAGCAVAERNGRSFLLCATPRSWDEARDACAALGFSLATVTSEAENAWLAGRVEAAFPALGAWHGFSDGAEEGVWRWVSNQRAPWPNGEPAAFTAWAAGQPDDADGGEDCAGFAAAAPAAWQDAACSTARPYVCSLTEVCGDGTDNDVDGQSDCVDSDCSASPACLGCTVVTGPGDTPYLFCGAPLSWVGARIACQSLGFDLVTVNDATEQAFVWARAFAIWGGESPWIGFSDGAGAGDWRWVSGQAPTYVAWGEGAPDGADAENCAALGAAAGTGEWDDVDCYGSRAFVCERSETCGDGADNDADGRADCRDADCSTSLACAGCEVVAGTTGDYLFCADERSWAGARLACQALGFTLVTVSDAAENRWLGAEAASRLGPEPVWLGLNDAPVEGQWGWVSGMPSSFVAWAAGEPDDAGAGQDATALRPAEATWQDESETTTHAYVCEYRERCGDGVDNDGDGLVDCADAACDGGSGCEFGVERTCGDGADNDSDGVFDCLDLDCAGVAGCEYGAEAQCNDGRDNDADGFSDCADLDCSATASCGGCIAEHRAGTPYLFCPALRTHAEAEQVCAGHGFALVTVDEPAELGWLVERIVFHLGVHGTWIGLSDEAVEGMWRWASGQAVTVLAWGAGVPDGDSAENCAAVSTRWTPYGLWDDRNCDEQKRFVCELDERCGNGLDDDGDGLTDCADARCQGPQGVCAAAPETACADGVDNDADGRPDCADFDCVGILACEPAGEASCGDGFDNDGDGALDCLDLDCSGAPECDGCAIVYRATTPYLLCPETLSWADALAACEAHGFTLATLGDADENEWLWDVIVVHLGAQDVWHGLSDTATEGVWRAASGQTADVTIWGTGQPSSDSRASDCAAFGATFDRRSDDRDCAELHAYVCERTEWCNVAGDEDGDGLTDCGDARCQGGGVPCEYGAERTCGDGFDNDSDGLSDCLDPDCAGRAGCDYGQELQCADGRDNDADGVADCLDVDCDQQSGCDFGVELTCGDAFDNDGDGFVDCADLDCSGTMSCGACIGEHHESAGAEHAYLFCGMGGSWTGAQDFCASRGFSLVTINDEAEQAWLAGRIEALWPGARPWHGLSDSAVEGQWTWVSGQPVDFAWWYPGEPNDAGTGEDCGAFHRNPGDGAWNDAPCDNVRRFVCEQTENCGDGFDNDGDGASDCLDSDCSGATACSGCLRAAYGGRPYLFCPGPVDQVGARALCASFGLGLVSVDDAAEQAWLAATSQTLLGGSAVWHGLSDATDEGQWRWLSAQAARFVAWAPGRPLQPDPDGRYDCALFGAAAEFGGAWLDLPCSELLAVVCEQSEVCDDGYDNNQDGRADCADPECDGGGDACEFGTERGCADGRDNDVDGLQDCADPDCGEADACQWPETACTDLHDNDGDGAADCADPDCAGATACETAESRCGDDFDNDGDGLRDCADDDCLPAPDCELSETQCGDAFDNDGDALTDCQDDDCLGQPLCTEGFCTPSGLTLDCASEVTGSNEGGANAIGAYDCAPTWDESGPEQVYAFTPAATTRVRLQLADETASLDLFVLHAECRDGACVARGAGTTTFVAAADETYYLVVDGFRGAQGRYRLRVDCLEVCDNGLDDNGNGLVDCHDADCDGVLGCELGVEVTCGDGFDNDADGVADCADADCAAQSFCEAVETRCGDGFDNDADGQSDCGDPDCDALAGCEYGTESHCGDGFDNDADAALDCADADCAAAGGCEYPETRCRDGFDNDGDGARDCADADCPSAAGCERPEASCQDGFDNDGDGTRDCADADCAAASGCEQPEANCQDGFDNDGDGTADCADADCAGAWWCEAAERSCHDGFDNDGDGLVDCLDPHCHGRSGCEFGTEAACADLFDNDGDGLGDCLDPDCAAAPLCQPVESRCADGFDNDGDGAVDCADADCAAGAPCESVEATCTDGFDNDGDGLADCGDPDCTGVPACPETCVVDAYEPDGSAAEGHELAAGAPQAHSLCPLGDEDWWQFDLFTAARVAIETAGLAGDTRMVLYDATGAALAADDDGGAGAFARIVASLPAGSYSVWVGEFGADAIVAAYTIVLELDPPEDCGNGRDDDGDGAIDCADLGCSLDPRCVPELACADAGDDDGDGLTDCADPDCAADPVCLPDCAVDAFEPDDSAAAARPLVPGTPAAGRSLCPAGDADWFTFTLAAAESVQLEASGAAGDPQLTLYDAALNAIGTNNDGGADAFPRLRMGLPAGSYFVQIAAAPPDGTVGDYSLALDVLPERCADGSDDDGDGLTDCADPDCAGILDCPAVCAGEAAPLLCGVSVAGSTSGGPEAIADYGIVAWDESGPEAVFTFTAPTSGLFAVTLADLTADLDVFVLASVCQDDAAFAFGDATAAFEAEAGVPYFVVVDGYGGAAGDFTLTLACPPPAEVCTNGTDDDGDGAADCADADCDGLAGCEYGGEASCADGFDNDGDGLVDCGDGDCAADPACLVCVDAFEPDESAAAAADIAFAVALPHAICPTGDVDWATFVVPAAGTLTVQTNGPAGDTEIALYDAALRLVAADDDSGVGDFSWLAAAVSPGVHFVRVNAWGDNAVIAAYTLQVDFAEQGELCGNGADDDGDGLVDCADADCTADPACQACVDLYEPDNGAADATALAFGVTEAHALCPIGDDDWWTFTLLAARSVAIETAGPAGDTRMGLYDRNLVQLAFDDDSGPGYFSRIERSLPAGTYFVRVSEYGSNDIIALYTLRME